MQSATVRGLTTILENADPDLYKLSLVIPAALNSQGIPIATTLLLSTALTNAVPSNTLFGYKLFSRMLNKHLVICVAINSHI